MCPSKEHLASASKGAPPERDQKESRYAPRPHHGRLFLKPLTRTSRDILEAGDPARGVLLATGGETVQRRALCDTLHFSCIPNPPLWRV